MTESRRRGACPSLSAPMPTGDGLLVRLLPAAPVPLDAMAGLCEAARRHGNGTIEITARGSLQIRGLTVHSAPLFAATVGELGIAAQEDVPVIAGFDDAVDHLAVELRRAIAEAGLTLSPKVCVVVDGDGPLHLDALSADVRLRAAVSAKGPRFHLGISSGESSERRAPRSATLSPLWGERERAAASGNVDGTTWLGMVPPREAVEVVVNILKIVAAHGPAARAANIVSREGVAAFRASPIVPAPAPVSRTPAEMIGLHAMRDGTAALGIGLAFGHTHADALQAFIRVAARYGALAVRPAPERTMLLNGVSMGNARDLSGAVEQLGFVMRASDPRRRIAACPGMPACTSGLIPARTLASTLAPALAPVLDPQRSGVVVHISGCSKGCAHPAPAELTFVGTPQGCGVVRGGTAREVPHQYIDPARLGDAMAGLAATPAEARHG
jgi:precorrin-3B synthase